MKKIAVLFLLINGLVSYEQTPNYFDNNPQWNCGEWNSDQWNPPNQPYNLEFTYYLNGDTLIFGNTFYRVFKKGYKNLEISSEIYDEDFNVQTQYYIRQVGNSIRFYTPQINSDSLLVDYNYAVGDTVRGYIFSQGYLNDTIQKIDSVLVGSTYRNRFYLDSITGPVVIEGIGQQLDINSSFGEFLQPLIPGIGFNYYINCYGQNLVTLWASNGNEGDCYLNLAVENSETISINIVPNPAINHIKIDCAQSAISLVKIYTIQGELVISTTATTIDLDSLQTGVYVVNAHLKNGEIVLHKLMVH